MTTIGFVRLILLWAVNRNFLYYVMMERFSEICGTVMYFSYVKQCWNLAIFYPILLYVNSILAYFKRSKSIILTILEALNFDFWEFYSWKCQKFKIHSYWNGQKNSFGASKWPKFISRKIWMAEKFLIFYTQKVRNSRLSIYHIVKFIMKS